jgi:hypothetical protein
VPIPPSERKNLASGLRQTNGALMHGEAKGTDHDRPSHPEKDHRPDAAVGKRRGRRLRADRGHRPSATRSCAASTLVPRASPRRFHRGAQTRAATVGSTPVINARRPSDAHCRRAGTFAGIASVRTRGASHRSIAPPLTPIRFGLIASGANRRKGRRNSRVSGAFASAGAARRLRKEVAPKPSRGAVGQGRMPSTCPAVHI